MFSIISKKASFVAYYDKGTYYCWKDWDGNLYQKIPSGSITSVSECRVKVPRNAKNIKVYLIGGGSGGYQPDAAAKSDFIEKAKKTTEKQSSGYCANTGKTYTGVTHGLDSSSNNVQLVTGINNLKSNTGIIRKSINDIYFKDEFSSYLLKNGYCCLPLYARSGSLSMYAVPKDTYYYSIGNNRPVTCPPDNTKYNICYNLGYFIGSNNKLYDPNNQNPKNPMNLCPELPQKTANVLYLDVYPTTLKYSGYKESAAGDLTMASALAGQEYRITKDDIGSGGSIGQDGKDTKFNNAYTASGGKLTGSGLKSVVLRPPEEKISDMSGIINANNKYNFCNSNIFNCMAKYNAKLEGISGVEFKLNKVNEIGPQFDISKEDDVIQKGFGLFGISGPDAECTLNYKYIKKVTYNRFNVEDNNYEPQIVCKSKVKKGMGGAIIIKWD